MQNVDEYGFPIPASFEGETKKRPTGKRGWRVLLLGFLGAALLGAMIQFTSDVADNPPPLLRSLLRDWDQLMGNTPEAIARRFEAKRLRGDLDGALSEAGEMVEVFPEVGHLFRGMILGEMGRNKESIDEYSKAIELGCPLEATAYNNRAYSRALERVDLKQALSDVEHALRIRGDEPAFIDTRGYIYYLLGEMELALKDFDSILENPAVKSRGRLGSEFAEIYFHRGLVHRFLGNEEKATQDFLEAQRLGFTIKNYPEPVDQPTEAEPNRQIKPA